MARRQFQRRTHPLLASHNPWTWKFIPGLVIGYLAKWWLDQGNKKPQVTGEKKAPSKQGTGSWSGPVPPPNEELKMVLCVNDSLKMGKGKIAAQCAHAAYGIYRKYHKRHAPMFQQYEQTGQTKVALKVPDETELRQLAEEASRRGLMFVIIQDAGRTQIAAGSTTVLGLGPARKADLDKLTGHLKLL